MASKLAEAFVYIGAQLGPLEQDLAKAKGLVDSTLSQVSKISAGILAASGIEHLVGGIKQLAAGFVSTNDKLEQYRISLGVMLKDQAKANGLIKEVQKFAAKTPFSTESLMQGIQLLKAYGFETGKLLPMMRSIGDAAAASPAGMETGVHRISLALGQMQAKGRVMTQEINQLTEAGVAAWDILSEKMGMSVSELMKKVESGQVSAKDAIPALLAGMDQRFGGMMEKQSRTWSGLLSTLQDNVAIAMQKIGEPLFGYLKEQLTSLTDWMNTPSFDAFAKKAGEAITDITDQIKKFIEMIWEMKDAILTAAGVASKLFVFSKVAGVVGEVTKIVKGFAGVLTGGLTSLISPVGILTAGIAALAIAFANAKMQGISFGESVLDLANKIGGLSNAYSDLNEAEKAQKELGKFTTKVEGERASEAEQARKLAESEAAKKKQVATQAMTSFSDKQKEADFQEWYGKIARERNLDPNPDNYKHHYDYRRAWMAGAGPNPEDGHWPSEFKLADHPNRYVDGVDTITGKDIRGKQREDAVKRAGEEAAAEFDKEIGWREKDITEAEQHRAAIRSEINKNQVGENPVGWFRKSLESVSPIIKAKNVLDQVAWSERREKDRGLRLLDQQWANKQAPLQEEVADLTARRDAAVSRVREEMDAKMRAQAGAAPGAANVIEGSISSVWGGLINGITGVANAVVDGSQRIGDSVVALKKKYDDAMFAKGKELLGLLGIDDKKLKEAQDKTARERYKDEAINAVAARMGIDPEILRKDAETVRRPEIASLDSLYDKVQSKLGYKKEDAILAAIEKQKDIAKDTATNTKNTVEELRKIPKYPAAAP